MDRLDIPWRPRFRRIDYVNEGMRVLAPYGMTGSGIRCVVTTAAGHHARVVNELYKFDRWFHIDDLRHEENNDVD